MVYDLIVIGAGPAGYLAAERAGHAGLSVALIEKRFVGGVCLNEGCIPTKSLLYSAKVYEYALHGEKYGVTVSGAKLNHAFVVDRKNKVVKTLVAGIKGKLKQSGVTLIEGTAEVKEKTAEGFTVAVGDQTLTGKRLLIASGSTPVVPPIPGLKEGLATGFVATNREILDWTTVPAKLAVIGGGVIGLEMASYFASAGSEVTVIEMLNRIGGMTDIDIANILMKNYQKKGVKFCLGAKVVEVAKDSVIYELDGQKVAVPADKVLVSIGRRAATEGLGLDKLGIETERGRIKTDAFLRTNIPGVYAAGDVNGTSMLAHTAYREAEVAVNHMLGKKDIMRYEAIPAVIYTNPEVGSIGETQESAEKKGMDVRSVTVSMRYSGRYVAENEGGDGICILVVDKKTNRLLGVHMLSNYASEIIWGAAALIETEMRVEDIKELVFPHPTVCEAIREALFEL